MKIIASLLGVVLLSGCTATYKAAELTDKFSDPSGPKIISMQGNSIDFHDPMGSVKPGELDAFVARERATNKPTSAGFFYQRIASGTSLTFSGEPKWLSIRAGDEAVFIADGARIVFKAAGGDIDSRVRRGVGYSVESEYMDSAQFIGTVEDLRRVAEAKKIEFKISGRDGAVSYPREGRQFLESFHPNIRQFYSTEVAPYR